jgi:polyisoprenoid-binding protein YceI
MTNHTGPRVAAVATRLTALRWPLLVAASLALPADALASLSAGEGARVAFTVTGPGGLKINGTTSELAVADDGQNVTVTVTLTRLTTGIDLRDRHMRDKYLETQTYPTTTLVVPRAALQIPGPGASQTSDAQGTLTLHGQTRPSSLHYAATNRAGTYRVDGNVRLNMNDFGVVVPSYLGVTVKPDVDVEVHFQAVDR